MRRYSASLLVGLLAGGLYHLLGTPSPAPPWPALAGLAGIVLGERATRTLLSRSRRRDGDDSAH
ncbi:XapX domain-containing protein [Streptomyces kaniharaensis]|uniref:XapX domain-containing protein n=1 Tax=Streptomyces kaniharaensis TaxID=212423 RepID=A0A6N7KWY2_9ACTN|nr:XapX domain-containing protein [Streptomyces kaniharaensis]